ncbi:DUF6412 domain-containing protein [Microbacterium sp. H1-D42]|uniref:DUF6412 domain-containing protein n=1 Tax=Microbacterium sp. H1-D42 TaxID=2925844 RepID=UPI001F53A1FF|nr:DUF6412 domain-containing protein [Microbacterium sp. H1-D42]UNK71532.1 DUF6412 domain-containing protein [Microbacterium sp. H1-D42]
MIDTLNTLLQLMLTALGAVPLPVDGMLGVAAVLVALAVLTLVIAVVAPHAGIRSAPHPRRAIDVSTRLAQSHPDADGHPRPRAPGVALAA